MANANGWGDGASNNNIGWGKGADNAIGWGAIHADSWAGLTDIVGAPAFDPDAQAFITAAAITDPTQQSAINQLVVDLKGYGVWTKMKALYPFVGGTASTHKFNLKDPRDLDVAFRLQFIGGGTWNNNGYTTNGTNGYADTKFNTFTNFGSNYAHQSVYLRNNTNSIILNGIIDINGNRFDYGYDANKVPFHAIASTTSVLGVTDTRTDGFIISFRTGNTTGKYKRNNVDKITTLPSFTLNPNINYFFGARNSNGSFQFPNVQEIAFASLGDTLTDTEAANFYTAVQAFQVSLSRNV